MWFFFVPYYTRILVILVILTICNKCSVTLYTYTVGLLDVIFMSSWVSKHKNYTTNNRMNFTHRFHYKYQSISSVYVSRQINVSNWFT